MAPAGVSEGSGADGACGDGAHGVERGGASRLLRCRGYRGSVLYSVGGTIAVYRRVHFVPYGTLKHPPPGCTVWTGHQSQNAQAQPTTGVAESPMCGAFPCLALPCRALRTLYLGRKSFRNPNRPTLAALCLLQSSSLTATRHRRCACMRGSVWAGLAGALVHSTPGGQRTTVQP